MTQVTRVPFGLQDLLGTKSFGENPSDLSQTIAPTLDLTAFLKAERRAFQLQSSVQLFGNGQAGVFTIPTGQLWFVHSIATRLSTLGTDPFHARVCAFANKMNNSSSPGSQHALGTLGVIDSAGPTGGGFTALSLDFQEPVPFFGGEEIELQLTEGLFTGTNSYTNRLHIRYTKLFV